jgi:hypothetical protein
MRCVAALPSPFISRSAYCRTRASRWRDVFGMRLLLIPLLLAVAIVLTAIVLATPPKAGGAVGPATQHQDGKN